MLKELPQNMDGEVATVVTSHLFQVNNGPQHLTEEKAQFFHHNFAKNVFSAKRARSDIQTDFAFLSNHAKNPYVDGYRKLGRVIKYLRSN